MLVISVKMTEKSLLDFASFCKYALELCFNFCLNMTESFDGRKNIFKFGRLTEGFGRKNNPYWIINIEIKFLFSFLKFLAQKSIEFDREFFGGTTSTRSVYYNHF